MKNIYKSILGVGLAAFCLTSFTGCIDETEPTNVATETQIAQSASATQALLMAMPAYFNHGSDSYHFQFGYGAMMHIRDAETGDLALASTDYGWFNAWQQNQQMGESMARTQYTWNYYWGFVQTANNMVGGVDEANATTAQLGYLGAGYAFRAMLYLDLARMYEFLPNDVTTSKNTAGNDVSGLTVPIVKAGMSEDSARVNPRVSHAKMAAFIENDLNEAEKLIVNLTDTKGKVLPDLACVYGLKARLYMWNEDYANAQKYARLAIDNSSVGPMTQDECLNTKTGFNVTSPWMWGAQQTSQDYTVNTGIINWTSWMSPEATFGYSGAGAKSLIDANLYNSISDTDFRKLEFKAPDGSKLASKVAYLDAEAAANYPEYTGVKFRPNAGNTSDYATGAASAYPIMRVEEMYFIEAEAAAHQDAAKGKELVTSFMTKYRDPKYVTRAASTDEVVKEVVLQKRIEFWGEGLTFFDIKRLNMSVTRGYAGTDFSDLMRFNTKGRPGWMNTVIVQTEQNNNSALVGWNNPDPTGLYTPWTSQ